MFKYIEPEVPGGLGKDTIMDTKTHPPLVSSLHFEFSGWLGDDIIESFPCFLVTDRLRNVIIENKLSGVTFDKVKISLSDEFKELYPPKKIPDFHWMKVIGDSGKDDFGLAEDFRLVVSENALNTLELFNIGSALIEDYL